MLTNILATKREEVARLMMPEQSDVPHYSFYDRLRMKQRPMSIIAEVKKASPSKGLIRPDFDPVAIAKAYERANVNCLSVLTDEVYFQGSLSYMAAIKQEVALPILRKDFIVDRRQIEQSVRAGADAILLIGEALEAKQLHELYLEATENGLDVLVEVHHERTLTAILREFTPRILGVNNRDLSTFTVSLETSLQLRSLVPQDVLFVSESGIADATQIATLLDHHVDAVLVGESFMRQADVTQAVHQLVGEVTSDAR